MSSTFTISTGQPVEVKPTQTKIVAACLFPANKSSNEAWVLARAGINNDGPVCIRLVNQYGSQLSDYVESHSSSSTRLKLQNVKVPSDGPFPQVVRVEVVNKSTVEHSNASVEDVLVVLQ